MSLQILRRPSTQTLSQQPLCLRSVLLRIREREHRRNERRAYWRRFFGLDSKSTARDVRDDDYTASTAIAEAIIAAGVVLFLTCLMVIVAWLALI